MHIPDGFLSTPVWISFDITAPPVVAFMARRAQSSFEERKVPLLGVMGAFIFAAQMVNFPVGIGTSGHLVGGALLAITLGPAAASIVMTAILAIQALVFQDGGILALGANVMNMAVVGVLAGYLPYHLFGSGPQRGLAIFSGGVLSVMLSAALALLELLISGVRMPGPLFGVSLLLFLVSALIEGAITLAVVNALEALQPDFIQRPAQGRRHGQVALVAVSLFLAFAGIIFASASPDGIEKLLGGKVIASGPLADYRAAFISSPWLSRAIAGLAGLFAIYALCAILGRLVVNARRIRSA